MKISRDYGVLLEDEGIALRGVFIIDPKGILRWARFCVHSPYNVANAPCYLHQGKSLSMTSLLAARSKKPFV